VIAASRARHGAKPRTGSGTDTATDLYWGHGRALSNNTRDTVYLHDAGWTPVDEYSYPAPRPWP